MCDCNMKDVLKRTTVEGKSVVEIMRQMKTSSKDLTTEQMKVADSIRGNYFLYSLIKECLIENGERKEL